MAKECTLSTGKLLLRGLPRNFVVKITDCCSMTSAVYLGRKETNQTNKQNANSNSLVFQNLLMHWQNLLMHWHSQMQSSYAVMQQLLVLLIIHVGNDPNFSDR